MEQNTQHKIEVLSKRRCSKSHFHYIFLLNNLLILDFLFGFYFKLINITVFFNVVRFFSDPPLHQHIDWSYPMSNHHHTYNNVLRRVRKYPYYQPRWRRLTWNGCAVQKSSGGHAILWELDKVDRQIHALQSEIDVLKQQLNIIRNYCAPSTETVNTQQANYRPRYILFSH